MQVITLAGFHALFSCVSSAQSIPYDQAPRSNRWDGGHGVIFFGRGVVRSTSRPIRSYIDGSQRGADINIVKDFPNLRLAVVDDLCASPGDSTVIAAVLNFGSSLRHVILTYDASARLQKVWDTEPYYDQAVTCDDAGNVFALGDRLNEHRGSDPPDPLVTEYDSNGKIVRQILYSNTFRQGSAAIDQSEDGANPSIMKRGGYLHIYAPSENEVLICSPDGTILRRAGLDDVLLDIQRVDRLRRASIQNVAFVDDTRVVLDLVEYAGPDEPRTTKVMNTTTTHTAIYLFDLVTKKYNLVLRGETGTNGMFLGTKGNEVLTLGHGNGQGASIDSHSLF